MAEEKEHLIRIKEELLKDGEDIESLFCRLVKDDWYTLALLQKTNTIDFSGLYLEDNGPIKSAVDYFCKFSRAYRKGKYNNDILEILKLLYEGKEYTDKASVIRKQRDIIKIIGTYGSKRKLDEIFSLDFRVNLVFADELADELRRYFEFSLENKRLTKKDCIKYRDKLVSLMFLKLKTKSDVKEYRQYIQKFIDETTPYKKKKNICQKIKEKKIGIINR